MASFNSGRRDVGAVIRLSPAMTVFLRALAAHDGVKDIPALIMQMG